MSKAVNGDVLDGPDDPDFNDYGFASSNTNELFRKYMEKNNPGNTQYTQNTENAQSNELLVNRDACKAKRRDSNVPRSYGYSNPRQPEKERKVWEMSQAKRDSPQIPMDFETLLKFAADKQAALNKIGTSPKKRSPSRLMTAREKRDLEEHEQRQRGCGHHSEINLKEKANSNEFTFKSNAAAAPLTSTMLEAASARKAVHPSGSGTNKSVTPLKPDNNRGNNMDEDSEYDSDLNDFIDDSANKQDTSSHIRTIFGYDKRKYRGQDKDVDGMESSFAQVQREEFISKQIGQKEDLEDMRQESLAKKIKFSKNRNM